jgi:hypothetical protein
LATSVGGVGDEIDGVGGAHGSCATAEKLIRSTHAAVAAEIGWIRLLNSAIFNIIVLQSGKREKWRDKHR